MAPVKEKTRKQRKISVKDIILYALSLGILGFIGVSQLYGIPWSQWGDQFIGIIGDLVIYMLGLVGIFEFGYDNGLTMVVPDNFISYKEKRLEKQTKEYLHAFFDEESNYLRYHEDDRLADTLSIMGLSAEGYREVQAKVLEARLAPMHDIESARQKLLDLVFYSDSVIDMHRSADQMNSGSLRYYMKVHDLMHNSRQSDQIAKILATFIRLTCEEQGISLADVDVIMVPHSGNFLLGLEVSKLLGKRFIKMLPPEKKVGNYSFEGVLPHKARSNDIRVIMVHDVLLSGKQILESACELCDTVPNCRIVGLFSLIYRNIYGAKESLDRDYALKCYNVAELTEEDIRQELEKREKNG